MTCKHANDPTSCADCAELRRRYPRPDKHDETARELVEQNLSSSEIEYRGEDTADAIATALRQAADEARREECKRISDCMAHVARSREEYEAACFFSDKIANGAE